MSETALEHSLKWCRYSNRQGAGGGSTPHVGDAVYILGRYPTSDRIVTRIEPEGDHTRLWVNGKKAGRACAYSLWKRGA